MFTMSETVRRHRDDAEAKVTRRAVENMLGTCAAAFSRSLDRVAATRASRANVSVPTSGGVKDSPNRNGRNALNFRTAKAPVSRLGNGPYGRIPTGT